MCVVPWLQGVLDKIRLKIQKLEKAIVAQKEQCKEPCQTSCPIPVVSGELEQNQQLTELPGLSFGLPLSFVIQVRSVRRYTGAEDETPRCILFGRIQCSRRTRSTVTRPPRTEVRLELLQHLSSIGLQLNSLYFFKLTF